MHRWVWFWLLGLPWAGTAQQVQFAATFSSSGTLIQPGDEFAFDANRTVLALQFTSTGPIPVDTLYIILKDIDGIQGRFYMKRAQNTTQANGLVRFRKPGIYRAYIYHPGFPAQPLAFGRVYITAPEYPTKEALLAHQRRILIARGLLKAQPTATPAISANSTSPQPGESPEAAAASAAADDSLLEEVLWAEETETFDDYSVPEGIENDDFNLEEELEALETDELEMNAFDDEFGGEFESFDDLDDDFEFEIEDF